jgi:Lrp/AsnC family transcriptional regulator
MTNRASLDDFDLALLSVLQEDCSLSIADLGERIHLSQNACWKRVKRLEATGVIKRRVALLDARALGVGTTVFVSIRAAEHSQDWLGQLAAAVRRIPEVVEFYRMSGDVDYLLKLQVADIAAYDAVYKRLIDSVRLASVSSAFAMEEIKQTTCLPLSRGAGTSLHR